MARTTFRVRLALAAGVLCLVTVAGPGRAQVPVLRPGVAVGRPAEQPKKRQPLSPTERLVRDFQSGRRSGAFLGLTMHALDRALAGETNRTDFDEAVGRALARNPGVSRAALAEMVAAYRAVPVEVRARAMPADLASLDRATGLTLADAYRLGGAPAGARGIIVQGGLRGPGRATAPARPLLRGERSGAPRIDAVSAVVQTSARRLVIDGAFDGTSPIVPIYLKPAEGQSLTDAGSQVVDGEPVAVVLGRVDAARSRIEAGLPVGLLPGRYDVSARVPRGREEPKTNVRRVDLAAYAYTVRLLSIRCIDESNPESVPTGVPSLVNIPVSDEVRLSWAAFADAGTADVGLTSVYEGFDDGEEQEVRMQPNDDGPVFVRSGNDAVPGVVGNRLFVIAQLWEVDGGDDPAVPQDGRFLADIGRASLDELDVRQFLERLSQSLYWSMAQFRGSHESLGEVRLSFSASELQDMTNNEAGRYRGEMRFPNGDATGSYLARYEIRRQAVPR
jgi:hypothetical protein